MDRQLDSARVSSSSLCHYYGKGESRTQILFDNTVLIPPGQMVVITGPSGSGKTTLLTLIGALRSVQQGRLTVLGRDMAGLSPYELTELRCDIGFIFQMHNLFESLTAQENVLMATARHRSLSDEVREQAGSLLTRLGLGHRIAYKPQALSGGQRQRVAVARALINQPKLILADEPTAALDKEASETVVGLLREMVDHHGSSVLMVTHDHRILSSADRVISMVDGRIASDVLVREAVVICQFLRSIDLFSSFGVSELGRIAEKMTSRPYDPGEVLIRQGDVGHDFFLLGSGEVDVLIDKDGRRDCVATLEAGASFGERALMTGDTRGASVVGRKSGTVYVLKKPDFDEALRASPDFCTQIQQMFFHR